MTSLLLLAALAPRLSIDAGASDHMPIAPGWPVVVVGRLTSPTAFSTDKGEIVIASTAGPWTKAVTLALAGPAGVEKLVPHLATEATAPTARLDANSYAAIGWYLAPEETAGLAPGNYTVTVKLDTTTSTTAGAWKGKLVEKSTFTVDRAPRDAAERKALAVANLWLLRGDEDKALASVEAFLASNKGTLRTLELKGDILLDKKKYPAAAKVYQQALAKTANANEPPSRLSRKLNLCLAQLVKQH